MTISSIQAVSFTAVRLSISERPAAAATSSATTTPATDQVTLSPGATVEGGEAAPASAGQPPPTRAQRRAGALFGALDADHDGAVTEQEFTDGAIALLRRAGNRHQSKEHDVERSDGHESRGQRRLERTLEKAFNRVDANDDGTIDQDELTTALANVAGQQHGGDGTAPGCAPPPQDPAATSGTTVTFSVTYVSVAVQRYTSLQPLAATAPADAPAATAPVDGSVDPAAAPAADSRATSARAA